MLHDSSKTENYCRSDENLDLTILSETIHNPSGVTLTMFMRSFVLLGAFLMNN